FLLAQLGGYAAGQFGERAAKLDFSRPQAGLLRLIGRNPGQSQQAIAATLGTPPSRLVTLVRGLPGPRTVQRPRNPARTPNYELPLRDGVEGGLAGLSQAAHEHEDAVCAPLTAAERGQLHRLLGKLAAAHHLRPGVHPGYRDLGGGDAAPR